LQRQPFCRTAFESNEALSFLRSLRDRMQKEDSLLIGFDMQKEKIILTEAYNDRAGITATFNLNILARINRELGGKFELNRFRHCSFYNAMKDRIEMYLYSTCRQRVEIEGIEETFDFEEAESIHTENSYKYTRPNIITCKAIRTNSQGPLFR